MTMNNPLFSQGLTALAMAVVVTLSWQFCYRPAAGAYRQDCANISTLTKQLADVEAMLTAGGGKEAWLARHQQRLAQLKARFPTQAELPKVLNLLVDVVKSGELKLLNVGQGSLEALKESNQPVLIEGMPCYRLPVTMTTEGRYHAVVTVMERFLSETFQGVVSVKQAELTLKKSPGVVLSATLQLDVYLLNALSSAAPDRITEPSAQPTRALPSNE